MSNMVRFQVDNLLVEHRVEDEGRLWLRFQGSYLGSYDKVFQIYQAYLTQLVELTSDGVVSEVELHIEELGQMISRAKHAIFGMLQGLRQHVSKVGIYASSDKPEHAEHHRMMRLFIKETLGQKGASVELLVA